MARVTLDFTGVERSKFLNAEGDFVFVIEGADIKDSKKGDSQNIVLELSVDSPGQNNGQTLTHYVNLGESSLWSARQFLETITGTPIEGEFEVDTSLLVGIKFGATVIKVFTNGKNYFNIDTVYSLS